MDGYQGRVLAERSRLARDIEKLKMFIKSPLYTKLEHAEQDRLQRQMFAMEKYHDVLNERIAAFAPE